MEIWKKMWVGVFFLNTVYLNCECACRLPSSTPMIAIYKYFSDQRLIYHHTESRRPNWHRCLDGLPARRSPIPVLTKSNNADQDQHVAAKPCHWLMMRTNQALSISHITSSSFKHLAYMHTTGKVKVHTSDTVFTQQVWQMKAVHLLWHR